MDEMFLIFGRAEGKIALALLPALSTDPNSDCTDARLLLELADTMEKTATAFRQAAGAPRASFSVN